MAVGTIMTWSGQALTELVGLQIHSQRKRTGVLAPKRFVQRLKKDNELFRSYMHQVTACPGHHLSL